MPNPCVKTGFVFLELETGLKRRGDLFFGAGMFYIRGINKETAEGEKSDAIVYNCTLALRRDDSYYDSNFGVKIMAPTTEFLEHLKKYYPELISQIETGANDGQAA